MAAHEQQHIQYTYDPVRLHPLRYLINRIDMENEIDSGMGPGINPETARPFEITDLTPDTEIRMQLRKSLDSKDEYFPGQNTNLLWEVIQDYPFDIRDEIQMSEYVNSLAQWITDVISLPRDSTILWKGLNLLRLNCQCSESNKSLFRSVNGFHTLIEALGHHFSLDGRRGATNHFDDCDTVNISREILKFAAIVGFSAREAVSITNSQLSAECFCGMLRTVYFRCLYTKDKERIISITRAIFNNPRLDRLKIFFDVIYFILTDRLAPSVNLILCADIAYAYCNEQFQYSAVTALYSTLKTLIERFYESDETNAHRIRVRVIEEYSDRSAALEKVLKILCQLCARYSGNVVNVLIRPGENPVVSPAILILQYALLHPQPREDSFNGRHLLYALLINKYIYESSGGEGASPDDIKTVFDFAMSPVPGLYFFNGRRKLKELADQVVDKLLDCPAAGLVLRSWTELPL